MKDLPCSECIQTKNHCCVADVPHGVTDALYYKNIANHMNIECMVVPSPHHEGMAVLVKESMRGKDIHFEPCIFLKDNRCSIYENRPTICRSYGTACSPCPIAEKGFTTAEEINSITNEQLKLWTKEFYVDDIFQKIMNGEAL